MNRPFRRLALLLGLWLMIPAFLPARHLTPEEAKRTAEAFYQSHFRMTRGTDGIPELRLASPKMTRSLRDEAVYAFNAGEKEGFVLVSADDRLRPVAGYALNGSFSYEDMPAPLRVLLDDYARQLQAVQASGIEGISNPYVSQAAEEPEVQAVAPLLGDICWSQDEPFNVLCPMDKAYKNMRTPVGCVATAAAQIMKYHGYPAHGIGNRAYNTSQGQTVSADFETATYDWANMLPDYNGTFTPQQANAVALLCYHVAVASRMDFDYEGSGTSAKEIAKAFTRYFGYDKNIEYIDRTHYDEPAWDALMLAELEAGRPILQFGEGEGGGHAFVCDGHDGKGFFHYNWGWGGMSDGYFRSSVLEPEYLGIGSGLGAYNFMQSMLTNIQPPTEKSTHLACLQLAKVLTPAATSTGRNDQTSVKASFYNYGLRNFTGEASLLLCDDGGRTVEVLSTKNLKNIRELEGGTQGSDFTFTIPAEVKNGTYRLYLAHKESGATAYTPMRTPVTVPNYLLVTVGDEAVEYGRPAFAAKLSLTEKPKVLGKLYNGRRGNFSITVRNDGEEFYSYLGILMQSSFVADDPERQYVGVILTRIPKGETRTFTYSTDEIEVPRGPYDVVAVCDHSNAAGTYLDAVGPDSLMVATTRVFAKPSKDPEFVLDAPLQMDVADVRPNQMFSVKATLKNNGGYGDGEFALIFINRAEEVVGNSNIIPFTLDENKTADIVITHKLNVPAGQYAVVLAKVQGLEAAAVGPSNNNGKIFNVVNPQTGISDVEDCGDTPEECWYNLAGQQARHLRPGIYISPSGKKMLVK